MKKGWDKYAAEKRYIKKGYLRKYRNGNPVWKATETSCSHCTQQGGKKEEIIYIGDENESLREEDVGEAYQQGQQGIQITTERGCEVEEINSSKTKREKMKKQSMKEKKHEAKETKAYEKKEDKKENKSKKK